MQKERGLTAGFLADPDPAQRAALARLLGEIALIREKHDFSRRIAARWGGEEFIILLPATDREAAAGLAEGDKQSLLPTLAKNGVLKTTPVPILRYAATNGSSYCAQPSSDGSCRF